MFATFFREAGVTPVKQWVYRRGSPDKRGGWQLPENAVEIWGPGNYAVTVPADAPVHEAARARRRYVLCPR